MVQEGELTTDVWGHFLYDVDNVLNLDCDGSCTNLNILYCNYWTVYCKCTNILVCAVCQGVSKGEWHFGFRNHWREFQQSIVLPVVTANFVECDGCIVRWVYKFLSVVNGKMLFRCTDSPYLSILPFSLGLLGDNSRTTYSRQESLLPTWQH